MHGQNGMKRHLPPRLPVSVQKEPVSVPEVERIVKWCDPTDFGVEDVLREALTNGNGMLVMPDEMTVVDRFGVRYDADHIEQIWRATASHDKWPITITLNWFPNVEHTCASVVRKRVMEMERKKSQLWANAAAAAQSRELELAVQYFQEALSLNKVEFDAELPLALCRVLMELGKYQDALDNIAMVVKRAPTHAGAYALGGQCFLFLGHPRKGLDFCGGAIVAGQKPIEETRKMLEQSLRNMQDLDELSQAHSTSDNAQTSSDWEELVKLTDSFAEKLTEGLTDVQLESAWGQRIMNAQRVVRARLARERWEAAERARAKLSGAQDADEFRDALADLQPGVLSEAEVDRWRCKGDHLDRCVESIIEAFRTTDLQDFDTLKRLFREAAHLRPSPATLNEMETKLRDAQAMEMETKLRAAQAMEMERKKKQLWADADTAAQSGKFGLAIKCYQEALALSQVEFDAELPLALGRVFMELGKYQDALDNFTMVVKHDPTHAHAYALGARCLLFLGDPREGLDLCGRVIVAGQKSTEETRTMLEQRLRNMQELDKLSQAPSISDNAPTSSDCEQLVKLTDGLVKKLTKGLTDVELESVWGQRVQNAQRAALARARLARKRWEAAERARAKLSGAQDADELRRAFAQFQHGLLPEAEVNQWKRKPHDLDRSVGPVIERFRKTDLEDFVRLKSLFREAVRMQAFPATLNEMETKLRAAQASQCRFDFGIGIASCRSCKAGLISNRGCRMCKARLCKDCSRKHRCDGMDRELREITQLRGVA